MDDSFAVFEQQIEKLIEAVVKLKTEKKQLLEANEELQERIKQIQGELDKAQEETDSLKQSAQGSEPAKEKLDSLLSRINDALGE